MCGTIPIATLGKLEKPLDLESCVYRFDSDMWYHHTKEHSHDNLFFHLAPVSLPPFLLAQLFARQDSVDDEDR